MNHETQNMIIAAAFIWFVAFNIILTGKELSYKEGFDEGFAQGVKAECTHHTVWTFTGENSKEPYAGPSFFENRSHAEKMMRDYWVKIGCTGEETCVVEWQ